MRAFCYSLLLLLLISIEAKANLPSYKVAHQELSQTFILDNGMKVVIISNKDATESAASITIGAGQRQSPIESQGLAHLLEHAVFLGSENFPEMKSWDKFIRSNGGWSNGSTRSDNTRYHFQISNNLFEEGLIRFKDKIFHPKLSKSALDISLSEVNEEFLSKKNDDWQGILSVIRANTSARNSASKFGIGNAESLGSNVENMSSKLRGFHSEHYVPNNMALAIYTDLPFNKVTDLVNRIFNFSHDKSNLQELTTPLHEPEQLSRLISIHSDINRHSLDLRFEVPPKQLGNNRNTAKYIAHLLGHESTGSIFQSLKSRGLAHSLSVAFQGDSLNEVLDVYIDLSERGAHSLDEVISTVFAYINEIRNEQHELYIQDELSLVAKRRINKAVSKKAGDWVSDVSDAAIMGDLSKAIIEDIDYENATHEEIDSYLSNLSPDNLQAYFTSPTVSKTNKDTPYYERGYSVKQFSKEQVTRYINIEREDLSLPSKNKYLVKNNVLSNKTLEVKRFEYNELFKAPESLLVHYQLNRDADKSKTAALALVFEQQIKGGLGVKEYFAHLADYQTQFIHYANTLGILFSGNKQHLYAYATDMLQAIHMKISKDKFNQLKEDAIYSYEDVLYKQAYKQAIKESQNTVQSLPPINEMISVIGGLKFDEYTQFLKNTTKELVVFGSKNAPNLTKYFTQSATLAVAQNVPELRSSRRIIVGQAVSGNAISYTLTAPNRSYKSEAIFRVLKELTSAKYSELMREQERIAYIAGSTVNSLSFPSISYVVESSSVKAERLTEVTAEFLHQQIATSFNQISLEDFETSKRIAIESASVKKGSDNSLLKLSYQYSIGDSTFERDKKVVNTIKDLSVEDIVVFLASFYEK